MISALLEAIFPSSDVFSGSGPRFDRLIVCVDSTDLPLFAALEIPSLNDANPIAFAAVESLPEGAIASEVTLSRADSDFQSPETQFLV